MESSRKFPLTNTQFGIELESNLSLDEFPEDDLLEGWAVKDEHCGSEIVSPILKGYKGLMSIRRQLKALYAAIEDDGSEIVEFDDCGLHVHVDIQNYTVGDIKRLLAMASKFDGVLFALMPARRRDNDYCRHIHYTDDEIDSCRTLRDFHELQGQEKYYGTNIMAFHRYGTVEFRYAAGTFDWRVIYSLVSLYLRLVSFAKSREPLPIYHKGSTKDGLALLMSTLNIQGGVKENLEYMLETNSDDYDDDDDTPWESIVNVPNVLSRKKVTQ